MSLETPPLPSLDGSSPRHGSAWRRWALPLAWVLLAWTAVSLLMAATLYADAARRGGVDAPFQGLVDSLASVGLLATFSWLLYLVFERWPERWMRARPMAGLYFMSVVLMVPLVISAKLLSVMTRIGKPWHLLGGLLLKQEGVLWWFETMMITGTFAAVVGVSVWQRSRRREQAWQAAQSDNLRLRLALLQGQLEPHFLFNTLNGISSLVRAGERGQALSALTRVSELLRYALRVSKRDWVTVQDELDFVREYLALQSLRFGDDLQLDWQIAAADWQQAACPPLLFQPLVENAIRHGLEAGAGLGRVTIALRTEGARIELRIENALGDSPSSQRGHGVGLSATRERLAMLYGAAAGLQTQQEQGLFVLEMSLPWREVNDEDVERTDR